ncbi:hypothetical protein [Streptomyces yanii]
MPARRSTTPFRYRLKRLTPVAGIGLHDPRPGDPKAEFEAML